MIWRTCEAFGGYPQVGGAMDQEVELVEAIQAMRWFAHVYDEMRRDPKSLTKDREEYLEAIEKLSEQYP